MKENKKEFDFIITGKTSAESQFLALHQLENFAHDYNLLDAEIQIENMCSYPPKRIIKESLKSNE